MFFKYHSICGYRAVILKFWCFPYNICTYSLCYIKKYLIYLQQKLCQLFIQLKTALMETYLKSEKEVLGIKWMEGQKNIQLWKSLKNLIFYESFFVEFINQLWDFQEVISLRKYWAGESETCSETNKHITSQLVENQVSF